MNVSLTLLSWAAGRSPKEGRPGGRLTECLQFQEQRAEDKIHFPPLGDLGGMPCWEGNLECQLITQLAAQGCTARPGGGNVFMSCLIPQAFFE